VIVIENIVVTSNAWFFLLLIFNLWPYTTRLQTYFISYDPPFSRGNIMWHRTIIYLNKAIVNINCCWLLTIDWRTMSFYLLFKGQQAACLCSNFFVIINVDEGETNWFLLISDDFLLIFLDLSNLQNFELSNYKWFLWFLLSKSVCSTLLTYVCMSTEGKFLRVLTSQKPCMNMPEVYTQSVLQRKWLSGFTCLTMSFDNVRAYACNFTGMHVHVKVCHFDKIH
jgi:hypothetical protein